MLFDYVGVKELFVLKAVCTNKLLTLCTGYPVHKFHGQVVFDMGMFFRVHWDETIGICQCFIPLTEDIQF